MGPHRLRTGSRSSVGYRNDRIAGRAQPNRRFRAISFDGSRTAPSGLLAASARHTPAPFFESMELTIVSIVASIQRQCAGLSQGARPWGAMGHQSRSAGPGLDCWCDGLFATGIRPHRRPPTPGAFVGSDPRFECATASFRYRRFTTVIGNNGAPRRDSASCCNRPCIW